MPLKKFQHFIEQIKDHRLHITKSETNRSFCLRAKTRSKSTGNPMESRRTKGIVTRL